MRRSAAHERGKNMRVIARGGLLALVVVAFAVSCGSSSAAHHDDGGSADRPGLTDAGRIACGQSSCGPSEICLVPPCNCVGLADPNCAPPSCVTPTPDAPVSCTPLDGGLSGTFTGAVAGSGRVCYHICL